MYIPRKRAIILTAVSDDSQATSDKASLMTQEEILDALAEQRNLDVVDRIVIPGISRNFYNWYDFRDAALKRKIPEKGPLRMEEHWHKRDFDEVLVYDGTRFGRMESIFIEFVLRTIDAGGIIVQHIGGTIDKTNYELNMLFGASTSARENRTRKERLKMGHDKRFNDGKHYVNVPITHIELYDDKHTALGRYELNPDMAPIWDHVKDLVLDGTEWSDVEKLLLARHGHVNPRTGKPFTRWTFHRLLTRSPMTWGIISRHHSMAERIKSHKPTTLHWMYNDRVEVPPDIKAKFDACPPVFTGADAELLKAELRRRSEIRGRMSPSKSHPYSGLCVCANCGYALRVKMTYKNRAQTEKNYYMACNYNLHGCTNRKAIRFDALQAYIDRLLRDLLSSREWPMDRPIEEDASFLSLTEQESQLGRQVETLVQELSLADDNVRVAFRTQIRALSEKRMNVQSEIRRYESQQGQRISQKERRAAAINDLNEMTVDRLWTLSPREINQFLRRLFDKHRLVIRGNEIVDIR